MVQRNAKSNEEEPEQKTFELPTEKEHRFQVVDVIEDISDDPDIVHVKLEVSGGEEEGRTTLNRISLDDSWKGFFNTRLFLKAIAEKYKGEEFPIDTDNWIGREFFATIAHNKADNGKTYANIDQYSFDKIIEKSAPIAQTASVDVGPETTADPAAKTEEEKAWDE